MPKCCIVYNFAPHYRKAVFSLIDKEWDCDWYFGAPASDVKELDTRFLKNVYPLNNRYDKAGNLIWQNGSGGLIRDSRYDTFLVLGEPKNFSTWWLLLQRRLIYRRKKVYIWSHGWYGKEGRFKKWLKRAFFGMADHTFTYGEHARSMAASQGFNPLLITPVHNSLDHSAQLGIRSRLKGTDQYRKYFKNSNPTLIFIGRLTPVKQLDLLIKAVASSGRRGEKYNIILVGDGECRESLQEEAQRLGIADSVWFYGPSYDDKVNASLIYDADLCVAPGNVGLTAMHSMVYGTPVITHDDFSLQMPEFEAIKSGKTGAFFRYGDSEDLQRAIREWFATHLDRDIVREECMREIDTRWTPDYQLSRFRSILSALKFNSKQNDSWSITKENKA